MVSIPRFNANITQISVPKMQDYQYEQNVSIYKTLKAAGERIDNTFFEIVAEGQLGQPGMQENPDYKDAMKQAADAAGQNSPYAKEFAQKAAQTPRYNFSWWR